MCVCGDGVRTYWLIFVRNAEETAVTVSFNHCRKVEIFEINKCLHHIRKRQEQLVLSFCIINLHYNPITV